MYYCGSCTDIPEAISIMNEANTLRQTFDEVALLYHAARPRYPAALFSALVTATGLQPGARLLEIGPGTGQATRPLAERGFDITAVELGAALADVARHELRDYKHVNILTGAFEEIILPPSSFDLVYAATAFHWIQPAVKYTKPHDLLKPGGHLAIIHTHHTSDEKGDVFFNTSQPIFDRYDFTDKHKKPELSRNSDLRPSEIDERLFRPLFFKTFPLVIIYNAKDYVRLLNTYSNHLVATKEVQQAFFQEMETLIHDQFGGQVEKHFSMSLTVAKRI